MIVGICVCRASFIHQYCSGARTCARHFDVRFVIAFICLVFPKICSIDAATSHRISERERDRGIKSKQIHKINIMKNGRYFSLSTNIQLAQLAQNHINIPKFYRNPEFSIPFHPNKQQSFGIKALASMNLPRSVKTVFFGGWGWGGAGAKLYLIASMLLKMAKVSINFILHLLNIPYELVLNAFIAAILTLVLYHLSFSFRNFTWRIFYFYEHNFVSIHIRSGI